MTQKTALYWGCIFWGGFSIGWAVSEAHLLMLGIGAFCAIIGYGGLYIGGKVTQKQLKLKDKILNARMWFRLGHQAKIVIDTARKSLEEDKKNNKLGDTTGFFSEEKKKEMVEDAKLAQASLYEEEVRDDPTTS